MQRSTDRILTTHAGSLPRSPALGELLVAQSHGKAVDEAIFASEVDSSSRQVIQNQLDSGIDIGNNGEQARQNFQTYIAERLTGFTPSADVPFEPITKDLVDFPEVMELPIYQLDAADGPSYGGYKIGSEVRHAGLEPIREECDHFKRIAASVESQFAEPFMTAVSPGAITYTVQNEFYESRRELSRAIATALRAEYAHIVSEGFVLQLDCPDLGMAGAYVGVDADEFLGSAEERVGLISRAVEGLPADRIRMHVCWGNYEGPHTCDVPMSELLPIVYQANVGALILPFADWGRHAHEWKDLERIPPPDHMNIVAGVIDTTTNYVEHPELVADRIERVAGALGDPTRVIAGADCGFGTFAGHYRVVPGVVWAKLKALREGADLATERLLR